MYLIITTCVWGGGETYKIWEASSQKEVSIKFSLSWASRSRAVDTRTGIKRLKQTSQFLNAQNLEMK